MWALCTRKEQEVAMETERQSPDDEITPPEQPAISLPEIEAHAADTQPDQAPPADLLSGHDPVLAVAVKAALLKTLKRIEPVVIEAGTSKVALLDTVFPARRKARCWDEFKLLHKELTGMSEDGFLRLSGGATTQGSQQDSEAED